MTKVFTIDFFAEGIGNGFAGYQVANVPIEHKAFELYRVIQEIRRLSGQSSVIIVAHSLGGLASRAYAEGFASVAGNSDNRTAFQNDVARIITIDTPHRGTRLAFAYLDAYFDALDCITLPSENKRQMVPTSTFLAALNTVPLPTNLNLVSVASFNPLFGGDLGDGIVNFDSQDLRSLLRYQTSNVQTEEFKNYWDPYLYPSELVTQRLMHNAVLRDPGMFEIVRRRIAEVDALDYGIVVGRLFVDSNGNGAWDVGEAFVAAPDGCGAGTTVWGVRATLTGPIFTSAAPRFCNPDPFYNSGPIPVGTYLLSATAPAGWGVTAIPTQAIQVRVGVNHAWLALRPTTTSMGFFLGRVFVDQNANGRWDFTESFIAAPNSCSTGSIVGGVSVTWQGAATGSSEPEFCNPDPFYHSGWLPAGGYTVSVTVPLGWEVTTSRSVVLDATPQGTHFWFGVRPPAVPSGFFLGRLFVDDNLNGIWDAGEEFVVAPHSCATGRVMTDVSLSWTGPVSGRGVPEFCNPDPFFYSGPVPPGHYTLTVAAPAGWTVAAVPSQSIDVSSGATHVWFALRPPGVTPTAILLGRLFVDQNGNGRWDSGESFVVAPATCATGSVMVGVGVSWIGPVNGSAVPQFCNPDPFYYSGAIPLGRYTLSVSAPAGWNIVGLPALTIDLQQGLNHVWFALSPPAAINSGFIWRPLSRR